ncbi:MAG: DUF416 family protein [Candidatus Rokuibacteriota bacterium]
MGVGVERFNLDHLEGALRELPSQRHRLAFGAGISERLLPNYESFAREYRYGDPTLLRRALGAIWEVVQGGKIALGQIRELQAGCRLGTPDPERFASPLTSAAIDAANAIHETLEVCYRDEPRRVAEVASFARDTVDMFVQERDNLDYSDPGLEERILADPLMIRELTKQQDELYLLARTDTLGSDFVKEYRTAAAYQGKSNIDVS